MNELAPWAGFLGSLASASATLTGFLFVAISINLSHVISTPGLTARAFESVMMVAGILIIAILGLVPGQIPEYFGIQVVAVALLLIVFSLPVQCGALRRQHYRSIWHVVVRILLCQGALVPLAAGGVLLAMGNSLGLYWLVPGIVCAIFWSVLSAWVLLVEIVR
ncbi:MAG TPA: hypothetical protein VKS60_11965 [Stellaceae bacterium]|nr:hypothetical protein [Stellaceae bacterium]